jgi:multidrug efflux system membrane fusion protein
MTEQHPEESYRQPRAAGEQQLETEARMEDSRSSRESTPKPHSVQSDQDEHVDQDEQSDQDEQDEHRQRPVARILSAAIILVTLAVAALVIHDTNANPRTDDAEVLANFIGMAPQVDGPILQLPVHDNQQVHAGDVLFEVDPRPYQYALEHAISDQQRLEGEIIDEQRTIRSQQSAAVAAAAATRAAEANVSRATASIDEAKADVANSQAAVDRAKAEYAYSVNNLHRVEPLLAKQFVTVDQVDQIRTGTEAKGLAVNQAQAQLALSQARLASANAAYAQSISDVSRSTAQTQQSQHAVTTLDPYLAEREGRASVVRNAQYNLNNCQVHAPFDARVTDLTISEGAYAHTGQQVFTLIDTRVWWVIANFRETQLHRIQPGMHVDVYLMSQPDVHYNGVVESTGFGVTPDASTIGTLAPGLPNVQRTLSWVHLASRYPVRIRIQAPAPEAFRIGESAVVVVRGFGSPARF